ncbi:hypothetical protein KY317_02570 [Candidatus Woesearchaeota archaeon]|nr:hypothetical protein [Candidatus Woesearchaeota archaeon]
MPTSTSESKEIEKVVRYKITPRADTYAMGVHALRDSATRLHPLFKQESGEKIIRPLTFRENIEAKIADYETLKNPDGSERTKEERLILFNAWLSSCTGVVYRANSTRFKIIPLCKELIMIDKNVKEDLPVDYDSMAGVELDHDEARYDELLNKSKVLEHPAWITALEDDKALLKNYADIVFDLIKKNESMGFWVINKINKNEVGDKSKADKDELRVLCLDSIDNNSFAYGYNNFDYDVRFVQLMS